MSHAPRTYAADIFARMVQAVRSGAAMHPRGASDKEYFAQDWFIDQLKETGHPFGQQGRNSYPDFWVGKDPLVEGYEVKSLAFVGGRPARGDIDFNSTIPSGRKKGREVFLVFFLYTGTGGNPRPVHSISLAHGDLINSDHSLADEHLNVAIRDFGSYADGFIRNRKMYVFPHPITLDPGGLGRHRLIVPGEWNLKDKRLTKVTTIRRTVATREVESYTIRLRGRTPADVQAVPSTSAGQVHAFDVFEMRG
jgi:hypothetical protein